MFITVLYIILYHVILCRAKPTLCGPPASAPYRRALRAPVQPEQTGSPWVALLVSRYLSNTASVGCLHCSS